MTEVWIASGNQLFTVEVNNDYDAAEAKHYMRCYNAWLNERNPIPLRENNGAAVVDANGVRYALQCDPRVVTRIDHEANHGKWKTPHLYRFFLPPEGPALHVQSAANDARATNRKRGRPIGS